MLIDVGHGEGTAGKFKQPVKDLPKNLPILHRFIGLCRTFQTLPDEGTKKPVH